ncbi:MAG TPA: hypothetical protein VGM39_13780 [Kofleriaceae bacterium]|jgi:hypothetical protein
MKIPIVVGVVSLLVGCGADSRSPVDPVARLDLRAAMHADDVTPVGLALDADGTRFIFDQNAGLLRVDGDAVVEVVGMGSMPDPGPTAPIKPPFTDLVAYAPHVFAVTALDDGYLLDTQAMTLTQHFCYLPGDGGAGGAPVVSEQRTDAIAYDAVTNRIYAQPISRDASGAFIKSEVGEYDATTGQDLAWHQVDSSVAATAMMTSETFHLILGQGSKLSAWSAQTTPKAVEDLERFGVRSIDGMALDREANLLIVVDKVTDAVFDIDLAQLDVVL